jgi:UDP-N-acetyl-D-mannosaminuronic acid dehydrogenase
VHSTKLVSTNLTPNGDDKVKTVAILGMGYVGLTLGVALARKNLEVYGVESDTSVLDLLRRGIPHFREVGLDALLKHYVSSAKLRLCSTLPDEVAFDSYIVSVGTPLDKKTLEPNISYINDVLTDVGRHMAKGSLVVMRSTIAVGASRNVAIPTIERASGMKAGSEFSFAFAPERTIEGEALAELERNPQVIGGIDETSISRAALLFGALTPTILSVSSLEAAEMVKLMDNSYRDVRFAYANEIAQICESMGLDANELIRVANTHYPRNSIPVPSPGVGGACLSKDPYILRDAARKKGAKAELIFQARQINEAIPKRMVGRIEAMLQDHSKSLKDCKVGIAGFAFKGQPETSDLRESTSIWFLDQLKEIVPLAQIYGYDPVVEKSKLAELGMNVCDDINEIYQDADVFVLLNNHPSYYDLDLHRVATGMKKPGIIYDSWRMIDKSIFEGVDDITYLGVGV